MKKTVTKKIEEPHINGTIDNIIRILQGYKNDYQDYDNLSISEEYTYDRGYRYFLTGERLENDQEEEIRLHEEGEYDNERVECERKLYEDLKEKFENND